MFPLMKKIILSSLFAYIRMFRQCDNIKIKTTNTSIILCTLSNMMLNASLFPMLVQTQYKIVLPENKADCKHINTYPRWKFQFFRGYLSKLHTKQ